MKEAMKNKLKRIKNGGYSIQWLTKKIQPYIEKITNEQEIRIISDIPASNNLALESRAKDMYFEDVLDTNKYSISSPLVIINPYGIAPLTAIALFNTKNACSVRCTICGIDNEKDLVTEITEPKTRHRIPIVGLYPNAKNTILIDITDSTGKTKCKTIQLQTLSAKASLLESVQIQKRTEAPSEDYIYVSGGFSQQSYMFDSQGTIRFYFNKKVKLYGTHMLSNGHLLFPEEEISNPTFSNPHSNIFHEMDFMGRVHKTYMVENGVHHYAAEKGEAGNILLATSTLEPPYGMENGVIEIDRQTGEVIKLLDLTPLFDSTYLTRHDWAHINSIQYLPEEDSIILSLRNLHSVVKIHWSSMEIEWILGDTKFWEPTTMMDKVLKPADSHIAWFYQQHAAEILSSNNGKKEILIYDNHIATRRPLEHFIPTEESNLLVFTIDETSKTVTMTKRFPLKHFSTIRSNGVFSKENNRIWAMSAYLKPTVEKCNAMIDEFDYTTGEILNKYGLANDFFSAYPIHFNASDMAKPLNMNTPYEVGHVIKATPMNITDIRELIYSAKPADPEHFTSLIYSQLLLVKETDNEIRHIYAVGNNHVYHLDKDNTVQKAPKTFADQRYFITFPLEVCAPDNYTFYLQTADDIYVLNDTIEIQKQS